MERRDKRGLVDRALERFTSRKLMVFGVSTWLLLSSKLDSEHWMWCALVYISAQSAIDFVVSLKKAS